MKLYYLFLVAGMFLNECSANNGSMDDPRLPQCMQERLEQLQKDLLRSPPAYVAQYKYKEQIVYYIPPAEGDQMSELYNEDCELICHPDGGITGRGDGSCPDFEKERSEEKIIWRDEQ